VVAEPKMLILVAKLPARPPRPNSERVWSTVGMVEGMIARSLLKAICPTHSNSRILGTGSALRPVY